jgi:hypothetical protein
MKLCNTHDVDQDNEANLKCVKTMPTPTKQGFKETVQLDFKSVFNLFEWALA